MRLPQYYVAKEHRMDHEPNHESLNYLSPNQFAREPHCKSVPNITLFLCLIKRIFRACSVSGLLNPKKGDNKDTLKCCTFAKCRIVLVNM
jgi:hypothetical protein